MKKTTVILLLVLALLFTLAYIGKAEAQYQMPRCYYPSTGYRYIPTQLKTLSTGTGCYVNVGGKLKAMGVANIEEPSGYYNNGAMTYENDRLYYPPTNEILVLKKIYDTTYGFMWVLAYESDQSNYYPLLNDYGRTLLQTGIIQNILGTKASVN